jgi:hypothetical protein
MASKQTASEAFKVLNPIADMLDSLSLGMAGLDSKGKLLKDVRGRSFSKTGVNQGLLLRVYRELPKSDVRRFILVAAGETAEPTREEMAAFKRRLLCAVRRTLNREVRKILLKLPRPVGRRERSRKLAKQTEEWVAKYQNQGMSKAKAVDQAARELKCDPRTIWNYLCRANGAKRRGNSKKTGRFTWTPIAAATPTAGGPARRSRT